MDPFESDTHSFIIKIWLEEAASETGQARWRGYITHVPSGERRYLQDLDDITAVMTLYLAGMGVKFGYGWRIRNWLRQLRHALSDRTFLGRS